jgi:hypothetical protein
MQRAVSKHNILCVLSENLSEHCGKIFKITEKE